MSNERRFLPLRCYEVEYNQWLGAEQVNLTDIFTATHHETDERGITKFYSDVNVIREYHIPLVMITITPVDEANIPR
jgi:hypothetical protein